MGLLNKLTLKNLKLNKKRTIVTIIGIMLSVALITAVATMYSSMIKSLINYETYEKGHFHVAYYDVPVSEVSTIRNTREVENVYLTNDIGYAILENSKNESKPYIFVKGFTKESLQELSVKLVNGKLPENEDEIVIPTHLKTNGRVVMNIGDNITINVGKRVAINDNYELKQNNPYQGIENEKIMDTELKTYKIVGIIERPASNIENYSAPGYTFITCMNEENMKGTVDAYTKYSKKGSKDYLKVTSSILNVDEEYFTKLYKSGPNDLSESELENLASKIENAKYKNYTINTYLIDLENNPLNNSTVGSLGAIVAIVIVIIIVTSVFCIKNSFDISITEKIKQYGMLRSVGATKKQIKSNVFYEATILGLIGIPLGLLLGFMASYILIIISNILLKDMFTNGLKLVLAYSWVAFAVAIILGILTIYFSAFKSARKASKVSPIDSIRNSSNIKIKAKKVKSPRIIKKVFGIGGEISYKNLKRNKKKYRTTVVSIIVSVSTFIALSFFINSAFSVVKNELAMQDYNISLYKHRGNKDFESKAVNTITLDNIEDYAIYKEAYVSIKNPIYNKEYIELGNYEDEYVEKDATIRLITIGDYQYKKYLKHLNLEYNEYKNKGILIDYTKVFYQDNNDKSVEKTLRAYDYKNGDQISIYNELSNISIEIGYTTNEHPFGLSNNIKVLIVSDEMFDTINKDNFYEFSIYYKSNNASKLQDDIELLLGNDEYIINNIEENAKMIQNLYTLVAIFLYGFIIVISLIGITNIFNTITTNMELRKQEFAMLKSIGMTKHEFSSMIRLESVFMGFKSLIIGIPIGIGLAYLMYKALNMDMDGFLFTPPYLAIIISIVVVYLLITILMKYSINKINKQNTIETIRNENI